MVHIINDGEISAQKSTFDTSQYADPALLPLPGNRMIKESEQDYNRNFAQFKKHVTLALQYWSEHTPTKHVSVIKTIVNRLRSVIGDGPPQSAEDYFKLAGEDLQEMIDIVASDLQVQKDFIDDQTKKMSPSQKTPKETGKKTIEFDDQMEEIQNHLAWLENYRKKFPVFQCSGDKH